MSAKKQKTLPRVVTLVGPTYEDDLADVDATLRGKLEEHVTLVTPDEAFAAGGVEGVFVACHGVVNKDVLARLGPNVKVVSNYGVGVDHITVPDCDAAGVRVGNTPDVLSDDVADMAWALLLGAARRVVEGDAYARSAGYAKYENMVLLGTRVSGKVLGIVGMGRIGQEIGKRGLGFGMRIVYHNRSRRPAAEDELGGAARCSFAPELKGLLEQCDFVVLVCPLTDTTRHLINAESLKHSKEGQVLVNVARGGVVDTAALMDALGPGGPLLAAGLDVTEPEPLPRDHPLLELENVVFAPHRGSATTDTRNAMADLAIRNLVLGLSGEPLAASCSTVTK